MANHLAFGYAQPQHSMPAMAFAPSPVLGVNGYYVYNPAFIPQQVYMPQQIASQQMVTSRWFSYCSNFLNANSHFCFSKHLIFRISLIILLFFSTFFALFCCAILIYGLCRKKRWISCRNLAPHSLEFFIFCSSTNSEWCRHHLSSWLHHQQIRMA